MTLFDGKVALITGATSGIGRATALAFAREGAKLALAGRRNSEGDQTVALVKSQGGEAFFLKTDVTNVSEVKALIAQTVETYGRLDYCFNNAGVESHPAPLTQQSEEDFDEVIAINLKGVFLSMKYEIPVLLNQGGGSIVNTSSVGGLVGFPNVSPYIASKHGVMGLTKAAALENAKANIRVNAVSPGSILTPMVERVTGGSKEVNDQVAALHPIGRQGKPEEVAEAVIWLCSDRASFITGQSITIDGGLTAT